MSNETEIIFSILCCLCTILDDCSRLQPQVRTSPKIQSSITAQPPKTTILKTDIKEKYIPPSQLPPIIL
jgi:hypothetical protein